MEMSIIIGLFFGILVILNVVNSNGESTRRATVNPRPIIGILTQPTPSNWKKPNRMTYLAASYVKYVEATGAQVVPIRMYQSIDYYLHLFNSLNGVIFPGGEFTDEFFQVAKLFYVWSLKELDDAGKIFPLWGTCLGFEILFMLTKGSTTIMDSCKGYNYATPVIFMPDAPTSRLLGSTLPPDVKYILEKEPCTANFHDFCMRPEYFLADPILSTFYRMLTVSKDLENRTFISTIESYRYPIFGVQWHPEKNGFEWQMNTTIPHTKDAVTVMQYMANFFTDQTRQNDHHFETIDDELKYLIYQFTPVFLGLTDSHFQQVYYFQE